MERTQRSAEEVVAEVLERIQEESKVWEAEGKDAWSALCRLGNTKLPKGDEVILARSLHAEYPRLKTMLKAKHIYLGDFCSDANLGHKDTYSKELHRMMLPPGATPEKIGLRRSANKYRDLLEAMASTYGVSPSSLASHLMLGMSIHPANADERSQLGLVQALLQGIIDRVDQEYGLFRTFMETAELKAKHAQEGGSCRWPHWDASSRFENFLPTDVAAMKSLLALGLDPAVDYSDTELQAAESTARKAELVSAMDRSRAYWESPPSRKDKSLYSWLCNSACGSYMADEFFYVPHVYIGYGEGICNSPAGDPNTQEFKQAIAQLCEQALATFKTYGLQPADEWNEETQQPFGQLSSMTDAMAHYHAWLIAYPSPDNLRLMPMLLLPVEEGGPILIPLDIITLSWLKKTYWVGPEGKTKPFFDRIQDLIGCQEHSPKVILEGLRRTAPWLQKNPFMKLKKAEKADQEYIRAFLTYLSGDDKSKFI